MRRMSRFGLRLLITLLMLLCLLAPISAHQHERPEPIRIQTLQEIEAGLRDPVFSKRIRSLSQLGELSESRRALLLDALDNEDPAVGRSAMRALAQIGDAEALAALRVVLADTTVGFHRRLTAAQALGGAADSAALPVLRLFRTQAYARDGVFGNSVDLAIRKIEHPEIRRSLIERADRFLQYRFLLDDIASIYIIRGSLISVYDGQIAAPKLSEVPGRRQCFPTEEFRLICDLLQDGEFHRPSMLGRDEYLVFELVDGRYLALIRSGDFFWLEDEWSWLSPGFCIRATSLAEYIDQAEYVDCGDSYGE